MGSSSAPLSGLQPQIPQFWAARGQSAPACCGWGSHPVSLSPCATVSRLEGQSPGSCCSQAIIILWQDQSLSSCQLCYWSCCLVGQAGKGWGASTDKMRVHRDSSSPQGSPPSSPRRVSHVMLPRTGPRLSQAKQHETSWAPVMSLHNPTVAAPPLKTCQPWQMAHLPMLMSRQDLIPTSH